MGASLMVLALALLASKAVDAHPFGGTLPGHELHLTVSVDAVALRYAARLPTHDVLAELDGVTDSAAFTERKLDELAANLRIEVDGARLRWIRLPADAPTGLGNSRSITYAQTLQTALPPGAHAVHISNGNVPDQTSYFFWKVEVVPPVRLSDCSLLDIEGARVLRTRDAQWRMDEEQRELHLTLGESAGPWAALARLAEPVGDAPVSLDAALDLGPAHELRSGRLPAFGVGLALVGAVLGAVDLRRAWRTGLPWLALSLALAFAVAPKLGGALLAAALGGALLGLPLPESAGRVTVRIGRVALALFAVAAGLVLME